VLNKLPPLSQGTLAALNQDLDIKESIDDLINHAKKYVSQLGHLYTHDMQHKFPDLLGVRTLKTRSQIKVEVLLEYKARRYWFTGPVAGKQKRPKANGLFKCRNWFPLHVAMFFVKTVMPGRRQWFKDLAT
jgi:hypothetical protein